MLFLLKNRAPAFGCHFAGMTLRCNVPEESASRTWGELAVLRCRALPWIAEESMDQVQQFLWVVAVDDVVGPGELAFGGSQCDHRQVGGGCFDQPDDVFCMEAGDAAVNDKGIDVRKQVKQFHRLLFRMGGDDIELEGLEQ